LLSTPSSGLVISGLVVALGLMGGLGVWTGQAGPTASFSLAMRASVVAMTPMIVLCLLPSVWLTAQSPVFKGVLMLGTNNKALTMQARTHAARGEYDQATALYEDLLDKQVLLLGKDHPTTLSTRADWATALGASGDKAEARQVLLSVQGSQVALFGEVHPEIFSTRLSLARLLGPDDPQGATELLSQVWEGQRDLWGVTHPRARQTGAELAKMLLAAGETQRAEALLLELSESPHPAGSGR